MTVRAWSTDVQRSPQAVALSDAVLRHSLATVVVPDLSGLRATFQALNSVAVQAAERMKADFQRAAETLQGVYKRAPRSLRRALAQGKHRRKTRDRCAKAWPGTDAVTPDHPARVVYKHLLARSTAGATHEHLVLLDRALTRCADADERALSTERISERISEPTAELCNEITPETDTAKARSPEPQRYLVAVTASRNAPADGHAYVHTHKRLKTAGPTDTT